MKTNEKTLAVSNGKEQSLADIDQRQLAENASEEQALVDTDNQQLSVNASDELTLANNDLKELAQKLKIQNLQWQLDFIRSMIERKSHGSFKDGNVEFKYKGFMFPEVKKAFEMAGFTVIPLKLATAIGYYDEVQVNIIKLADNLILSEDELEESRKYAEELRSKYDNRQIGTFDRQSTYPNECNDDDYDPNFIQRVANEIKAARESQQSDDTPYISNSFANDGAPDSGAEKYKSSTTSGSYSKPQTSYHPFSDQTKRIQKAKNRQNRKKKRKN